MMVRSIIAAGVMWVSYTATNPSSSLQVLAFTPARSSSLWSNRMFADTLKTRPQLIHAPTKVEDGKTQNLASYSSSLWRRSATLNENGDGIGRSGRVERGRALARVRTRVRNFFLRCTMFLVLATTIVQALFPFGGAPFMPAKPAEASAPIMALPKAEDLDPGTEALKRHEKNMAKQVQLELDEMAKKAQAIEASEGTAARTKFEKEYKAREQELAMKKEQGFIQLKRELLDQGIDPFCDIEGQRQVILYEKGIDMGEVSGTPFNVEKIQQTRRPKKSFQVRKAPNREMVKLMVQDLKARELDPLSYFESHKDQTMAILDMPAPKALSMLEMYKVNLEQYGQITKPQPGELSVKEKQAQRELLEKQLTPKAKAQRVKQEKAEAKAKAKAEKERARAEAKAEKERQKAEARAAKEQEAKRRAEEKQAVAAAATAAAGVAASAGVGAVGVGSQAVGSTAGSALQSSAPETATSTPIVSSSPTDQVLDDGSSSSGSSISGDGNDIAATTESSSSSSSTQLRLNIIPASAVVVGLGAGAYGFSIYRQRAAEDEEERQRQFRMLMQGDQGGTNDDETDGADTSLDGSSSKGGSSPTSVVEPKDVPQPAPAPVVQTPKKRRLGIFKSKRAGDRETDLSVLVSSDGQAPEFASLLGKILTFGAPGRFPNSMAVLGTEMPMDDFDLQSAKEMLVDSRLRANLEVAQSAEIFANVVNCMLIEIIDLASSSLKEKEAKKTFDAVSIVVDFMNHAASLYDAVAEGVTIAPVTYSGTLSRSKLEQMYSQYAVAGMMNMEGMSEDFDSRVALLQDVFSINEKKAEGLMLKAMQKNMMEMLKDGGSGMEDMLKNMGGGMEGLGGDGEGLDTEQLKAMLLEFKAAKDRGEYSKEELEKVRIQFKELFGSSMEDLFNESTETTEEDREVIDLMKSVLYD